MWITSGQKRMKKHAESYAQSANRVSDIQYQPRIGLTL